MFHAFFADSPNRAIAVLEKEQLVGWLPEFLNDVAAKGIQRKPTSVVGTTGSTTVTPARGRPEATALGWLWKPPFSRGMGHACHWLSSRLASGHA